ncbi:hypothetical protein [Pseudomonas sp. WS 5027]|nr:hypothetical protein [Pseudomonas sp. WS 5027]NMY49147.1 hypothetical protein [Pseudomonas sp. WS 5027]
MDTTGQKIRSALTVVNMLEAGVLTLSQEDLVEGLAILRERLQMAGDSHEETYALLANEKPGQAPAIEVQSAPNVAHLPNRQQRA